MLKWFMGLKGFIAIGVFAVLAVAGTMMKGIFKKVFWALAAYVAIHAAFLAFFKNQD